MDPFHNVSFTDPRTMIRLTAQNRTDELHALEHLHAAARPWGRTSPSWLRRAASVVVGMVRSMRDDRVEARFVRQRRAASLEARQL